MSDSKKNGNPVIIIVWCLLFVCGVLGTIAFVMEMTKKKCGATPASEDFRIEKYNSPTGIYYEQCGTSNITTPDECGAAAEYMDGEFYIQESGNYNYGSSYPKGCFALKSNPTYTYFNSHTTGGANDATVSICKKGIATQNVLDDTTTSTFIFKNKDTGLYETGTCGSKCVMDQEKKMVCNNFLDSSFSEKARENVCVSRDNKNTINTSTVSALEACIKNGTDSAKCKQAGKDTQALFGTIMNTNNIDNNLADGFNSILNSRETGTSSEGYTSKGDKGNRLRQLFREIIKVKNKDSDISNNKRTEDDPRGLLNYNVYLNLIAKAFRSAIDDGKDKEEVKAIAATVFKQLRDNGTLNVVFNEKIIQRLKTDLGDMLGLTIEHFTTERYQSGAAGCYICTAVKNTQKSVSDEDYQIITKFGKWAVQQPEYTKGLGLYFGAMRHLMPVISHMERDNEVFWDDLTNFFNECVDGVKSRDYDRVIHLFTVKSIHLAEKYFGGISHLKGVVPGDEYKVLQNVYDDRKKYVEKYVLAN